MATDNTQPEGTNPIDNVEVKFLGRQLACNSSSHRDLGFTGKLQGKWYAVYGDTMWCDTGVTDPAQDTEGFHGMVRNSLSALTDDPLVVQDLHLNDDEPVPHQKQLVPYREDWGATNAFGFGGTSIVETDPEKGTGALYYLINDAEHCRGAGVAKIELIDGIPTVTERLGENGWWWDGDQVPKYGDIATYQDVNSDYIYLLGNPPKSQSEWPRSLYMYMARVRAADAFYLDKYEYWWGRKQAWSSDVLTSFTGETAVMWGAGQGQIVFNYFQTYLYVHLSLTPSPEGPWAEDKQIYKAELINGGLVYAEVAYPFLDESGGTLTIGFTNSNNIQVIKATFVEVAHIRPEGQAKKARE